MQKEARRLDTVQAGPQISLEETQALFNTFLQATGEGFIAIDTRNLILMASAGLEQLWGYEPGELAGKPVQILMPRRYRRDHTAGVRRFVMENKRSTSGHWSEVEALHKDGSEFLIHIRIMRVQYEDRFLLAAAVRSAVPYEQTRNSIHRALELVQQGADSEVVAAQLEEALRQVETVSLADEHEV